MWIFSASNAIFSSLLLFALAGVHYWKMKRLRLEVAADINRLRADLAPLIEAVGRLAGGFLSDKIVHLEDRIEELVVRLATLEEELRRAER